MDAIDTNDVCRPRLFGENVRLIDLGKFGADIISVIGQPNENDAVMVGDCEGRVFVDLPIALEIPGKPIDIERDIYDSGDVAIRARKRQKERQERLVSEPSDRIFEEGVPIVPRPDKAARVAIDRLVLAAPGIRSVVLCNAMIYGHALGAPAESVQIPALARQAKASGVARYIGRGLNRWSNVHIADVAALYALALAKAEPGTFLYVESGEESLGNVVRAIAARLGLGAAQSMPPEDAIAIWGRPMAVYSLGSNSRVRGKIATERLGWTPTHHSVTDWIARELA